MKDISKITITIDSKGNVTIPDFGKYGITVHELVDQLKNIYLQHLREQGK